MKRDTDMEDMMPAALDDLFGELRQSSVAVPETLMARVLADADRLQPAAPGIVPPSRVAVAPSRSGGWRAALSALFGGGASLAGLAVAGAAGVWIGFAQPFDLGLGLHAATLESLDFYPADLDQWSEALAPDLLADD